jgi:2-hydroxy-6-oxonona-2,4-dienedioate hydrolase
MQNIEDLHALERLATRHALPYHDGNLVFRCWGPEQGTPIVFLHGGSGSWKHWARNISYFVERGRQVWIPDMPGFGESATPINGHDADALPEPLLWALQQLLAKQSIDLVTFSFGSMVGAAMAVQEPSRVNKLVLMGSPALGINSMRPFKLRSWNHLPEGPEREAIHIHNLGVLMMANPTAIDALAVYIHSTNLDQDRMKRRRLAYSDFLLQRLKELSCPVYGIWGALDILCLEKHDSVKTALQQTQNFRSLHFIPDAGHWVQYEAAPAFNTKLEAILNEQD